MKENDEFLLCSDLDRTILPNGEAEESAEARPLLRRLSEHPDLTLAYVSGRDRALIEEAIEEYKIPVPNFAVGDVGTSMYRVVDGRWEAWAEWSQEIAKGWKGLERNDLAEMLADIEDLTPQEPEKQNRFKLSFYADQAEDHRRLVLEIQRRLEARGIEASVIWSVDEQRGTGLLDVIPARATKLHAVRFLADKLGFRDDRVVFCGDSGNDLEPLTSDLPAVLVRNAMEEVRQDALAGAAENGREDRLYLARGGFLGMNGNYAAGVIEGTVHFLPQLRQWLEKGSR